MGAQAMLFPALLVFKFLYLDITAMAESSVPSQQDAVDMIGPILLERGKPYRKFKYAFLKEAVAGEKVQTFINGKLESENVAKEGDWIVRAATTSKERYIVPAKTFASNYDAQPLEITDDPDAEELAAEGFKAYASNRRILAVEADEAILRKFPEGRFVAAWGEPMLVEIGDYLASGLPGEDQRIHEVYRIEKEAFAQTYSADS